jgi:hypothetical protein
MRRLLGLFAIILLVTTATIVSYRDETVPFRRAAFISNRGGSSQIYISDLSGNHIQQVTHFRDSIQNFPQWSNDGRFLIFLSFKNSVFEVHWVDILGRRVKKAADEVYRRPQWAGTSLVLVDITSDRTMLLKRIKNGRSEVITSAFDMTFTVYTEWILYRAGSSLYLYHIPTRQTTRLFEQVTHFSEWDLYKDQVAYIANNQIYVNNSTGILPGPTPVENIRWSPDGQWIYFEDHSGNRSSVSRIRPDGSDLEELTDFRYCDNFHGFSPDGQNLLYMKTRCGEYIMDVRTINLATAEDTHHFTFDSTIQRIPRWTSDGRLTYDVIKTPTGGIDIMIYDIRSGTSDVFAKNPSADSYLVISPNISFEKWNGLPLLTIVLFVMPGYIMMRIMVSKYSGWRRN